MRHRHNPNAVGLNKINHSKRKPFGTLAQRSVQAASASVGIPTEICHRSIYFRKELITQARPPLVVKQGRLNEFVGGEPVIGDALH